MQNSFFDEKKCARGLDCLYDYQKEWDSKLQMFKNKPFHNWASHGAESVGYSALDDRSGEFAEFRQYNLPRKAKMSYNEFS